MFSPEPNFKLTTILFGGSFDPVHLGHLHIALEAFRRVPYAEQLLFVPSRQSPGKVKPEASAASRLKMLRIALQGSPFSFWDYELEQPGESYTVATLREAKRLGAKKLYWLMGADAYAHFSNWREPEEIRKLARLVVCARPGATLEQQYPEDLLLSIPSNPNSSTAIRESLKKGIVPEKALPEALEGYFQAILSGALKEMNPYASKLS